MSAEFYNYIIYPMYIWTSCLPYIRHPLMLTFWNTTVVLCSLNLAFLMAMLYIVHFSKPGNWHWHNEIKIWTFTWISQFIIILNILISLWTLLSHCGIVSYHHYSFWHALSQIWPAGTPRSQLTVPFNKPSSILIYSVSSGTRYSRF